MVVLNKVNQIFILTIKQRNLTDR